MTNKVISKKGTSIALSKSFAERQAPTKILTENAEHMVDEQGQQKGFTIADLEYFAALIEQGFNFEEALEELEVEKEIAVNLDFQQDLLEAV